MSAKLVPTFADRGDAEQLLLQKYLCLQHINIISKKIWYWPERVACRKYVYSTWRKPVPSCLAYKTLCRKEVRNKINGLIRVKLYLCLIKHRAMATWGSVITVPQFLTSLLDEVEWSVGRPDRFTPQGNSPRYTLDRRLGGYYVRSGSWGVEKNLFPLSRNEPRTPNPYLVAISTELFRFP
jgi:hypothetical protein